MCGIGQTANDLGTDHKELPLSENDLLESLPRALATMDQPTVDGINITSSYMPHGNVD
jgi:asparagine synthetase B (glutamine-hydrolysing)